MELIVSYLITNGVKYVEFCYANIFPANPFNVTIKIPLERFNTTLDFAVHIFRNDKPFQIDISPNL